MKHQYRKWRNGGLLVEKYVGIIPPEVISENDDTMYLEVVPEGNYLLGLTDISEASFPDLDIINIDSIFASVDKHIQKTMGMKVALFTGANHFDDFQKAMAYSNKGRSRNISIVPFNHLDSAMRWLGLTQQEQKEINEFFSS